MKLSIAILNEKLSTVTVLSRNNQIDNVLIASALIMDASKEIAKDKKISIESARKIIIDSILETKI